MGETVYVQPECIVLGALRVVGREGDTGGKRRDVFHEHKVENELRNHVFLGLEAGMYDKKEREQSKQEGMCCVCVKIHL